MSSSVSYEYYSAQFSTQSTGITPEGGIFQTFINDTGSASVKGTIVAVSTSVANAVSVAPAATQMPIGVIYENGIANGSPVKVVTYGRAQVLLKNGEDGRVGYWCGVSDVAGRIYQNSSPPLNLDHSREVGHSLQTVGGGTNVLCFVQIHFN